RPRQGSQPTRQPRLLRPLPESARLALHFTGGVAALNRRLMAMTSAGVNINCQFNRSKIGYCFLTVALAGAVCVQTPASFFSASALSVFSHVKFGSSRPKWPLRAVSL